MSGDEIKIGPATWGTNIDADKSAAHRKRLVEGGPPDAVLGLPPLSAVGAFRLVLRVMTQEDRKAVMEAVLDGWCKLCYGEEPCYCAPCYDE